MTHSIGFEHVMAYVDGELDAVEAGRVEQALAADPALAEQAARLREQDALVRAAFAPFARSPVQLAAHRAIKAAGRRSRHWPVSSSIAACLVLGVGVGWFAAEYRVDQRLSALEAARDADAQMILQVISDVLERQVSGQSIQWRDPASGAWGVITPLRTFRSEGGHWCREYVRTVVQGDVTQEHRAVACREGEGNWRDRLEILDES